MNKIWNYIRAFFGYPVITAEHASLRRVPTNPHRL